MSELFGGKGKNNERTWQCFVCAKNYQTYEDYKQHIIDNHDEGREYLTCPDCKAPVRDMKAHYKVKHPQRMMPKGLQHRVVVWKDYKTNRKSGKREFKARGPQFRQGTFSSKKSCADFTYRSGMECDFYECLEADRDVEAFFGEPFKVPYFYAGEWHNYIPDIKVHYIDGSVEIWEIKPQSQTGYEQNKAKWVAMNDYAHNYGWEFTVQTEDALSMLKKKVRRQQQDLMNEQADP